MPAVVHDWSYQEFESPIIITLPMTEHGRKHYSTVLDEKADTSCFTKRPFSNHWAETHTECSIQDLASVTDNQMVCCTHDMQ
jgi:hypothetical protein